MQYTLDLNKGVVQYFWLKQGCGAILNQGLAVNKLCGAILLDLNKGVVQYFWTINKGVVQYFWLKQGCGAIPLA